MKTTTATLILISTPAMKETNFVYYINNDNEITKLPEFIISENDRKKHPVYDNNNELVYQVSDRIQLIWLDQDNHYFITTYKTKYNQTTLISGAYGTSLTQIKLIDPLREYLIAPAIKQLGLEPTLTNPAFIKLFLKEHMALQFNVSQELATSGKAYNKYYVTNGKAD